MSTSFFSSSMNDRLPDGMTLPDELVATLDWLEAQGWLQTFNDMDENLFENRFLSIYPPDDMDTPGASYVIFNTTELKYTQFWSKPDPLVDARIFEIARTSSDGGRAALWLDPDGKQWFVHLGHDELGIISDDPVTFLKFLAMGYNEPGGFSDTTMTPLEVTLEYYGYESADEFEDDEAGPLLPAQFQAFLQDRFGVTGFPERASDLGIAPFTEYQSEDASDAFSTWMTSVTPEPTEEERAHIDDLVKMAQEITVDFDKPGFMERLKARFGKKPDDE